MNRIVNAIAKMKIQIEGRITQGLLTAETLEKNRKLMDMAVDEYVAFQNLKSESHLLGILTLDEAQTVYGYLGESPETFNRQPAEVKAVLTQLFKELLGAKIRSRKNV